MNPQVSGPYVQGKVNTQMTPLWHNREFAAGAPMGNEIVFFGEVSGVGGVGPEKTNMTRAFELEAPRSITVHAMRIHVFNTADTEYQQLIWAYTAQLVVGGNPLLNAPLMWWASGMGRVGSGILNGVADPKAIYGLLPHPIFIPSGTGFQVRLIGTSVTPVAAARIGIYLDGPFSKPVS